MNERPLLIWGCVLVGVAALLVAAWIVPLPHVATNSFLGVTEDSFEKLEGV